MGGYIKWHLATLFAALAAILAATVIIDPYGLFRLVEARGFNFAKTCPAGGGRAVKAVQIRAAPIGTLILGTSRALVGIDPSAEIFGRARAYNAALQSAKMFEIERVVRYVTARGAPKWVIIGLDLSSFSKDQGARADYEKSAFAGTWVGQTVFGRTLSGMALGDAWNVWRRSRRLDSRECTPDGFENRRAEAGFGDRAATERLLVANTIFNEEGLADFDYSPATMATLARTVGHLLEHGSRVDLFISPAHAWWLETFHLLGIHENFEAWKRDLVRTLEQIRSRYPGKPVSLWDFSGYNRITTEDVPVQGARTVMKNYFDAAHYVPAVGEMVLTRILGSAAPLPDAGEFGVLLSPENIEPHLTRISADRQRYQEDHPEQAQGVVAALTRAQAVLALSRQGNISRWLLWYQAIRVCVTGETTSDSDAELKSLVCP